VTVGLRFILPLSAQDCPTDHALLRGALLAEDGPGVEGCPPRAQRRGERET